MNIVTKICLPREIAKRYLMGGHLDFDIVSTARCPAENFELRISDFASLGIFTLVESPLQIDPFMQNKANFLDAQMNVNSFITKDYRKKDDFAVQKNKPNSNPISEKHK